MKRDLFVPCIWDRLMAAGKAPITGAPPSKPLSRPTPPGAQLHAAIARDLEDLFNTRMALPAATLDDYKSCRQTILNFGMMDFAALCLGSSDDQQIICAYVTETIGRFEPRLTNVATSIAPALDATNRLDVVIQATIKGDGSGRTVKFNAMLQPSTLQYAISEARGREPRP